MAKTDNNYNLALINLLKCECDEICGVEVDEQKQKFEKELLRLSTPSVWNIYEPGNAEVEIEVGFEQLILNLSEKTRLDVDSLSVFQFYTLLNSFKNGNP